MTVTALLGGSRLWRVSEEMRGFPVAIQYCVQSSQSPPLFSPSLVCPSLCVCVFVWHQLPDLHLPVCSQLITFTLQTHLPLIHHQLQSKTPVFHPLCCVYCCLAFVVLTLPSVDPALSYVAELFPSW